MKYLWLDLETAGLAVDAPILEIYCMLGDASKHEAPFHAVIKHDVDLLRCDMDAVAEKMHSRNGLLDEVSNGRPLNEVEDALIEHLKPHLQGDPLILAGSSVQYDLRWLHHHMPRFAKRLHHTILDVTSLWHLLNYRFPKEFTDDNHRAESDVHNAYKQFIYYYKNIVAVQQEGDVQTVGKLRMLLNAYPDTLPLCVPGVFDEFRPVQVEVKREIFAEDEHLKDRSVIGASLTVTPLFE